MSTTPHRTLRLSASLLTLAAATTATALCVDFDPVSAGSPWPCCGAVFNSDGVDFRTEPFQWMSGATTVGGEASIVPSCTAASGHSLWTNNVNVNVRIQDYYGAPVRHFKFHYIDYGGNINLRVNGVQATFENYQDIPPMFFGGVGVQVVTAPVWIGSAWEGDLELVALPGACINEVWTGGQELCLDDFCANDPCLPPPPCPADFDGDLVVGFTDLVALLATWGPCPGCPQDLDGDGEVGFGDLVNLLSSWGDC